MLRVGNGKYIRSFKNTVSYCFQLSRGQRIRKSANSLSTNHPLCCDRSGKRGCPKARKMMVSPPKKMPFGWKRRLPILIGPHLLGQCTVLHITNQHLSFMNPSLNSSKPKISFFGLRVICSYWVTPINILVFWVFLVVPSRPASNLWLLDLDISLWYLDDI